MGGLNNRNHLNGRNLVRLAIALCEGDNRFDEGLFQSTTNCTHHQNTMPSHQCLLQVQTEYTRNKRCRCLPVLPPRMAEKALKQDNNTHTTCYVQVREWVYGRPISLMYKRMGDRWWDQLNVQENGPQIAQNIAHSDKQAPCVRGHARDNALGRIDLVQLIVHLSSPSTLYLFPKFNTTAKSQQNLVANAF